ncbi:MAG TPA: hypothetical protein PKA82_08130 [Pyrinomonadaceae bacterium]|nr:hypothetical protein [Pyrinomonadaceae bacterium]
MKNLRILSTLALSLFTAAVAFAAPPPAPNLEVMSWIGNANPQVESPYQYTTRVKNIGNQTAQNVTIVVEFPLTNNSPTRYILGKLSAVSASSGTCSTAGNKITCNVGNIGNNQMRSVTFTFEHQVSTTAPFMKTTASTQSANEQNPNNNWLQLNPSLAYPTNIVTPGTYLVSSCTGRGLSSYYECEKSPSSIQSVLSFDVFGGGVLEVTGQTGYSGVWDQFTLPDKSLHINIPNEIDFNGYAVSGTCFKGITTFASTTVYNSAYKICRQ